MPEGVDGICFSRPDGKHPQLLRLPGADDPSAELVWAKPNLLVALGNYGIFSVGFRPKPHVLAPGKSLWGPAGEGFSLDAKADVLATSFDYNEHNPQPVTIMRSGGATTTVGDSSANNNDASLAPDGEHVVWDKVLASTAIVKASVDGTNVETLNSAGEFPLWSPSGRQIAFLVIYKGLYVMDAAGGHPTRVARVRCQPGSSRETMAWSPNGRLIACVDVSSRLVITNLRTKRTRTVTRIGIARQFVWAPDSKELLVEAGAHSGLWRVPIRSGKPRIVVGTA